MFSFISHINGSNLYPTSGPKAPNDTETTNASSLSIAIPPSLRNNSTFVWAGYTYKVISVEFGRPKSAFNLKYDVPAYSFLKSDPIETMPEPDGSIQIMAELQEVATQDSNQIIPSAAPTTLVISIPVYKQNRVAPYASYIPVVEPTNTDKFITNLLQLVDGDIDSVDIPDIFPINEFIITYTYTNPNTGSLLGVAMPSKGISVKGLPSFSFTQKGSFFADYDDLILRINDGTDGYSTGKLLLPKETGTSQIVVYSANSFTPSSGSQTNQDGIPIVVEDENGNRVNVTTQPQQQPYPTKLIFILGIVLFTVVLTFVSLFFLFPSRTPELKLLGIFVILFFLCIVPLIMSGSEISKQIDLRIIDNGAYTGLLVLSIILLTINLLLTFGYMVVSIYNSNTDGVSLLSTQDILGASITPIILLTGGFLILYTFITNSVIKTDEYNKQYQSKPLFLNSLSNIFKYAIPIMMLLVLGLPSNILNTIHLQSLNENSIDTFVSRASSIHLNESINDVQQNLNTILKFHNIGYKYGSTAILYDMPMNKTLMSLKEYDLTDDGVSGKKLIGFETKNQKVIFPILQENTDGAKSVVSFRYKDQSIKQVNGQKKLIDLSKKPKQSFMEQEDITIENQHNSWSYNLILSISIAVILGISLSAPAFVGPNSYGSKSEDKEPPTLSEKMTDFIMSLCLTGLSTYFIYNSGLYTTNSTGFYLIILAIAGAFINNCIALSVSI